MTTEEAKNFLKECYELKELTADIEDIEDIVQNCDSSNISIRFEFHLRNHYRVEDLASRYYEMLKQICLSGLKANLEKDLAELKDKLSKVEVKIETKS